MCITAIQNQKPTKNTTQRRSWLMIIGDGWEEYSLKSETEREVIQNAGLWFMGKLSPCNDRLLLFPLSVGQRKGRLWWLSSAVVTAEIITVNGLAGSALVLSTGIFQYGEWYGFQCNASLGLNPSYCGRLVILVVRFSISPKYDFIRTLHAAAVLGEKFSEK